MSHETWLSLRIYLNQLNSNSPYTTDLYTILNSTPELNPLSKNKKLRISALLLKLIETHLSPIHLQKSLEILKFFNFVFKNLKFHKESITKLELVEVIFNLVAKVNILPNTLNLKELVYIEGILHLLNNLLIGYNIAKFSNGLILNFLEFNLILVSLNYIC
jgi:hypothetical protein